MVKQLLAATNGGIDSDVAKWFARALIPAMVTIALGIFSWNAARVVSTLDLHGVKLESITQSLSVVDTKVTLFRTIMDFNNLQALAAARAASEAASDHEKRLRELEKSK